MGGSCGTHGERRGAYRAWVGRTEGKDHLEDLDINWRIILKWIFKKWDWRHGLDLSVSG